MLSKELFVKMQGHSILEPYANRILSTPIDIVVEGKTAGLERAQARDRVIHLIEQSLRRHKK